MGKNKRGFNPIRFIFKLLMWTIILFIGFAIFIVFMLYKDATPPLDNGTYTSFDQMIDHSLDSFLSSTDKNLFVGAPTSEVNHVILSTLKDSQAPAGKLISTEFYDLVGVWLETKDNEIHVKASAHVKAVGVTFKSQLHLGFKIEEIKDDEEPQIKLQLTDLTIGKLPLAWASTLADSIIKRFFKDLDIESLVEDTVAGSTFDLKTRTLVVDIKALVDDALKDEPQTKAIANLFVDVLYRENDFISFDITETQVGIKAQFSKLEDVSSINIISYVDQIKTEAEFEGFMAYKASALFLSFLQTEKAINFNDKELNQILLYLIKTDPLLDTQILFSNAITQGYQVNVYLPSIIINQSLKIEIPIEIIDINDANHTFKTKVLIEATPSMQTDDLILSFTSVKMGDITLKQEQITILIDLLNNDEMFQNGGIVIKDFKQQLSYPGLEVDDIFVSGQDFKILAVLNDQNQAIIDQVENNLSLLAADPLFSTDVTALQNALAANDDELIETSISNLLETLVTLDSQQQQAVLDQLLDGIDPNILGDLIP